MTERHQREKEPGKRKERNVKPWHIALFLGGILAALVITAAFVGFIQMVLQSTKDTEEYALAYECFLASETWQELGVEESRIRLNRYSISTNYIEDTGETTKTARIGFMVEGEFYEVVCIWKDGTWSILETDFD